MSMAGFVAHMVEKEWAGGFKGEPTSRKAAIQDGTLFVLAITGYEYLAVVRGVYEREDRLCARMRMAVQGLTESDWRYHRLRLIEARRDILKRELVRLEATDDASRT